MIITTAFSLDGAVMAVYGESPFAKFASGDSFENPKHTTPIAAYAASPPIAWRPSVPSALLGQSDEHHRRKANLSALLVLVLLACAFSAAYVMRPHQAEGTGNSRHPLTQPQLQSATLQRRYAGKVRTDFGKNCCVASQLRPVFTGSTAAHQRHVSYTVPPGSMPVQRVDHAPL